MKRKLLFIVPMFLFTLVSNAQTSIYSTKYTSTPPLTAAGEQPTYLTATGIFAATTSTTPYSPFDNVTYPSSYSTTGSAGFVTLNFPTALTLTASGTSKGKIIVHWGSVSNRPLNLSINGAAVVLIDNIGVTADRSKVRTATYDLPVGTLDISSIKLVSSGGGAVNLFDIDIQTYTGANPLATYSFKADSSATVYANGNQVFVANVKSNTTVAVYSVAGALVKTVETSSDTSFELASGVYVAKVKSAEGEKSVKLLVK